ncbi:MAG: hypothetical protein ABIP29_04150, partial [Candidatus Eisenbacteria bacterium]
MPQAARDPVGKLLVERLGPLGDRLVADEPMKRHTTLQVGGPADWYVDARSDEDVERALTAAAEVELP